MDVLEPFLLDFNNSPDLNVSDIEQEIIRLDRQKKVTIQFLRGLASLNDLLDCVADFGIDSYEYLNIVSDNIESVISNETPIENPSIILL